MCFDSDGLKADPVERVQSSPHADLRLTAMTAMASSLAHDLVQPLTAALNYLQASSHRLRKENVSLESLQLVDLSTQQVVKAVDLIRRMRGFAVDGKVRGASESLERMIERVRSDLAIQERMKAKLIVKIGPAAEYVLVDRIQIVLVLMNLIVNAIEAVQGRPRREVEIKSSLDRDLIEISITDTGASLTQDAHARLFDPWFTTKPHGTGLGLPICRAIVEAHGGRLWADRPTAECGTVFRMTLPSADES